VAARRLEGTDAAKFVQQQAPGGRRIAVFSPFATLVMSSLSATFNTRSSPCCGIVPSAAAGLRIVPAWAGTSEKARSDQVDTHTGDTLILLNIPVTIMLWRPPLVFLVIRFPLPVLPSQTTWI
jgi:hypothetical protein